MDFLSRIDIQQLAIHAFVEGGRIGHEIAVDHNSERGSNGYTFGNDRYHRSCEMTKELIEAHGFKSSMHGAGHRARRGDVELWFATAKGEDVTQRASFDFTTDARLDAGTSNLQPYLDGLGEGVLPARQIVHVVWSGDPLSGLTAVHVGQLVRVSRKLVEWRELVRVDKTSGRSVPVAHAPAKALVRQYDSQPLPSLDLTPIVSLQHVPNG